MKESTRAYIYRVLVVLAPVVSFYGLSTEGESELWLTVAGVVLGVAGNAVAAAFTSTSSDARPANPHG